MYSNTQNYFFTIEFDVATRFGMAIVTADSKTQAINYLKNSGQYNFAPDLYEIKRTRNVGKYYGNCVGLLLEHYGDGVGTTVTREMIVELLGFEPLSPNDNLIIECGMTAE